MNRYTGLEGSATLRQLAAMPSVHVGWAVFIAIAVIAVSTSPWRWLILIHPVITVFVVVATANHWWLDGIVGASIVGLAYLVEAGMRQAAKILPPGIARRCCPGMRTGLPNWSLDGPAALIPR